MNAPPPPRQDAPPPLRHFLDIKSHKRETLRAILTEARRGKARRAKEGRYDQKRPLAGKTLLIFFEEPSLRTRLSFDAAMREAGGEAVALQGGETHLGRGEEVSDMARIFSLYADLIALRATRHQTLLSLAEAARQPVINALTDAGHPCQLLADIMSFEEKRGAIEGRHLAWIGDANNMAASWLEAALVFGFHLRVASPNSEALPSSLAGRGREAGLLTLTKNPKEAALDADAVMTDCWSSLADDPKAAAAKKKALQSYRVDEALMALAKKDALFMHCLPAHRGEEVSASVIDGRQSVVWDEAENRLHLQKALLLWCAGVL